MLKGKFDLPQKKRVVLDRLGSLIVGLDDDWDSDLGLDSGEELETFRSGGFGSKPEEKDGDEREVCELDDEENLIRESELRICRRKFAEIPKPVSSSLLTFSRKDVVNKAAELEFELSQKVINLESVQRISNSGLPDGLRATTWKLLLGYLPADRDLWEGELAINRRKYAALKEELLLDPSEFSRRTDTTMASNHQERGDNVDGLLERHEISHGDHPLSMGKASFWHQYFQDAEIAEQIDRDLQRTHPDMRFFSGDPSFGRQNRKAMRNILLLFAKLNPAIRYVQGMNEVLAPLYYVFSTDLDAQNATNAEADSFACFVRLLSDSVDHFCQHLDNSSVGILSTLSRLAELLKVNDEELWRHLAITTKVKPQFYAFRWITLLLTQEFDLHAITRIWDSLLSNSLGLQEMLLRVCCAMLLCVRRELLKGDFTANLKLLQHYPQIDMEYLLQVAQELRPLSNTHVYM